MYEPINIAGMRSAHEQEIVVAGQRITIFAYRYDGDGRFTYLYLDPAGAPAVIQWDRGTGHTFFYSLVAAADANIQ